MTNTSEPPEKEGRTEPDEAEQSGQSASGRRTGNAPSSLDVAAKDWASRSAIFISASLAVMSVTGLWIYVSPFSVVSQIQLLLHVVVGLVFLVPYCYYQIRHFLAWYRQKMTSVMVLGYLLMAMTLVCSVSGVVLTWQAAVGPKLHPSWDAVHLITGLGTAALIGVHLVLAVLRRRHSLAAKPELRKGLGKFAQRGIALVGLTGAMVVGLALAWPASQVEFPTPEGYGLPAYAQQFEEYRGNPFAPTYARTESGMMVYPEVLAGSLACGTSGCHEQILAEWQPSAHRFSAMNPPFNQVQLNFAADREPAETRYCAGCHDPISLFAGAKDIQNQGHDAPGMQEGCSCVICHSISTVDERGNADYAITPPSKYIWESATGWKKLVSDFFIRAYPRQHLADYDRNLLRTPEFCGACHKQFIPEALNRFGLSPGQNQYDEWGNSHWHVDDPEKDLSCRDCHMRLVYDSTDPGRGEAGDVRRTADDGAHRHHGMIGTNMFMPAVMKLPHWETHVRQTEQWIRGETVIPEIAHLWPAGPVASIRVVAPEEVRAGEELRLRIEVANNKAGHNFTTGPLDFTRAWIHLQVLDADGRKLAEFGAIDPNTRSICDVADQPHRIANSRKEGTLVLEAEPLDAEGNPLLRHELWKKAGGKGLRVIFPKYSDNQTYRFQVPRSAAGHITLKAELNFRRYRQEFLDLVVPTMEKESGVYQPTVPQSSAEHQIRVVRAEPATPSPETGDGP